MDNADDKKQQDIKNGCIGIVFLMGVIFLGFTACSSLLISKTEYKISCMNEKGSVEWRDGTTQQLTKNLGTEVYTWYKDKNIIEVSTIQNGKQIMVKVPARLNGENLVFSHDKFSYIINTSSGKNQTTVTENSPDGPFIMKMEGSCTGYK